CAGRWPWAAATGVPEAAAGDPLVGAFAVEAAAAVAGARVAAALALALAAAGALVAFFVLLLLLEQAVRPRTSSAAAGSAAWPILVRIPSPQLRRPDRGGGSLRNVAGTPAWVAALRSSAYAFSGASERRIP